MKYEWLDGYLLSFPGAEKRWHPAWKMFLYEVRGKQFAAVCAPEEKYQGMYGKCQGTGLGFRLFSQ